MISSIFISESTSSTLNSARGGKEGRPRRVVDGGWGRCDEWWGKCVSLLYSYGFRCLIIIASTLKRQTGRRTSMRYVCSDAAAAAAIGDIVHQRAVIIPPTPVHYQLLVRLRPCCQSKCAAELKAVATSIDMSTRQLDGVNTTRAGTGGTD